MTTLLCALPFAVAVFPSCAPPLPLATGYVEGEYALIAPVTTAQIETVVVTRGDRVTAGQTLSSLESRDAQIALSMAEASLAKAESNLADLKEGKRPEEIRVIEASLASAAAQADEAARAEVRLTSLAERGAATQSERDDAATAAAVARAQVAQAEANLAVARLPARAQEIAAAEATVQGARAARDQAQWGLEQRTLTAPTDGTVFDIIHTPGEIAGPTAPVLSMLPDGAVKLRLYVPESAVSRVAIGETLSVHCDGCDAGMTARVTYVADGPEFTPPVIYSLENRQKLVYLIEARPAATSGLKPGQIVDVTLPGSVE